MKIHLIRETDVLRHCCEYLKQRNYFFTRVNNVPAPGRALSKYVLRGLPDIIILWKGNMICVECKRPALSQREPNGRTTRSGKMSMFQAEFANKVIINGGEYYVVRSVEELDKELETLRRIKKIDDAPAPSYGSLR